MPHDRHAMTKREMNLRVFEGRDLPSVLFQPRIEPWYAWHKQFGSLPPRYADMSLLELYDELDLSMRYIHYYTDMPYPVRTQADKVRTRTEEQPNGDLLMITDTVEAFQKDEDNQEFTASLLRTTKLPENAKYTITAKGQFFDKKWENIDIPNKETEALLSLS